MINGNLCLKTHSSLHNCTCWSPDAGKSSLLFVCLLFKTKAWSCSWRNSLSAVRPLRSHREHEVYCQWALESSLFSSGFLSPWRVSPLSRAPWLAPSPEPFTSAVLLGCRKHKWIGKSQFSKRKKITLENSIYNLVCAPSPYWVWRLRKAHWGNSLAVQWLGLGAFASGAWVWSLVGELISHKLCCVAKKKKKEAHWSAVCPHTNIPRSTMALGTRE